MAYLISYWKFNEIRKYNYKHSNVLYNKYKRWAESYLQGYALIFRRTNTGTPERAR